MPVTGTLEALSARYAQFLLRVVPDGLISPLPPFSSFRTIAYRRAEDRPVPPYAAFSLLKLDGGGFRPFDPARRGLTVAGMLRHAARKAAERAGWTPEKTNACILGHAGHDKDRPVIEERRLAFVPLPSLEWRGAGSGGKVGAIRRALVTCFDQGGGAEVGWAMRYLSGVELVQELRTRSADGAETSEPTALLSLIPQQDRAVQIYSRPSSSWATVTPVVLPGYDDPRHYRRRLDRGTSAAEQRRLLERLDTRTDQLLRSAIRQAGIPSGLADSAELAWNLVGFWPGLERAGSYGVPDHLRRFPRYHVQIRWRSACGDSVWVPGPILIGGGRFYGIGLFAGLPEES